MNAICEDMATDEILRAVGTLPSMPKALMDIIRTIEDENSSGETLAKQIETDLGLLSSVLRLVNSPRYSAKGGVSSAQQAVLLLGFNAVRNLVSVAGIADYFQKNCPAGFNYEQFFRHSAGVGVVAKQLAHSAGLNPDAAFVSGMLHDIVQLALAATVPNQFIRVMDYKKQHDCHIARAEQAVIGMDHANIGAHLAKLWHLPEEICEAIEYHHSISDSISHSRMSDLIHVSEVLAHALELGTNGQVPSMFEEAMLRLGLSLAQVKQALGKIEEEYCDFAQLLGESQR
jgi:putative nucleotidyltransferase with HDIG domain